MWVRMARIASEKVHASKPDAAFYQAKLTTATYYIERILPQTGALLYAIRAGKSSMMALEAAGF